MVLLSQFMGVSLAAGFVTLASTGSTHHTLLHREAIKELTERKREHEDRNEPGLHQIHSTLSLARGLIEERGTIGVPEEELRNILDRLKSLEAEVSGLLGETGEVPGASPPPTNAGNGGSAGTPVSDPIQVSANSVQDSEISAPIVSVDPTAEPVQPVNGQMEPKVDSGGSDGKGVAVPVVGSFSPAPEPPTGSNDVASLPQPLDLVSEVTESLATPTPVLAAGSFEAQDSTGEPMAVFKEKVYITTEDLKTTTVIKTRTSTETITLHRATHEDSQHRTADISAEKFAQASPEESRKTAKPPTKPYPTPDEKFFRNNTMKFFKNGTVDFMKQARLPYKPTPSRTPTTKVPTQAPTQEIKSPVNKTMKSVQSLAAAKMKIPVATEDKKSQINSTTKAAPIDNRIQTKFTSQDTQNNSTGLSADTAREKMQAAMQGHRNATETSGKNVKVGVLRNATVAPAAEGEKIVPDTFPDLSPINRIAPLNSPSSASYQDDAAATPTAAANKMKGHFKPLDFNSTMVTSTRSKL